MSEAEKLYRYNIDDEALERIFNERDEVIEARIRAEANAAANNRLYIISNTQRLFDALEKKTRRLQAQGRIIFAAIIGAGCGAALAALLLGHIASGILTILLCAVVSLFWAVIGR